MELVRNQHKRSLQLALSCSHNGNPAPGPRKYPGGGLRSLDSAAEPNVIYGVINSVVLTVTTQWTASLAFPFTLIHGLNAGAGLTGGRNGIQRNVHISRNRVCCFVCHSYCHSSNASPNPRLRKMARAPQSRAEGHFRVRRVILPSPLSSFWPTERRRRSAK